MKPAYNELYLDDAMRNMGEAFDYAVNCCGMNADDFAALFVTTGYADLFSDGNPRVIAGISGTEMAMELITKSGLIIEFPDAQIEYEFSKEYWGGWILTFYQWSTGRPFKDIFETVPMSKIIGMYYPLHEASEEKFVETLNEILTKNRRMVKLQRQRKNLGLSQSELARKSGINLRTLQQYETKAKDINKASVSSVRALASALGCRIEDILE